MIVTNLTTRPVILSDGTILAAAGCKGSSKEVKELSDRDQKRLLSRGSVNVEEKPAPAASPAPEPKKKVVERPPVSAPSQEGA